MNRRKSWSPHIMFDWSKIRAWRRADPNRLLATETAMRACTAHRNQSEWRRLRRAPRGNAQRGAGWGRLLITCSSSENEKFPPDAVFCFERVAARKTTYFVQIFLPLGYQSNLIFSAEKKEELGWISSVLWAGLYKFRKTEKSSVLHLPNRSWEKLR